MSTATAIEQMLRNVSESEDWRGLAEAANTADTDRIAEYRVRANMAMGLAYQYACIAQAEAAERQAAAMERANEIAISALDPWGAIEGLKLEAEAKDAEIARFKADNERLSAAIGEDYSWIAKAQGVLGKVVQYGGLPDDLLKDAGDLLTFLW